MGKGKIKLIKFVDSVLKPNGITMEAYRNLIQFLWEVDKIGEIYAYVHENVESTKGRFYISAHRSILQLLPEYELSIVTPQRVWSRTGS